MTTPCRPCWSNCVSEADPEILDIDAMEDRISPVDSNVSKTRGLISTLELCHHKAERWVDNIIQAIAAGDTDKGLGTRSPDRFHPAEEVWQNACAALSAWCAGCPTESVDLSVGEVPAAGMLACLGERSALKEWQVQRIIEKIRNSIRWPQPSDDPTAQYVWLLIGLEDDGSLYRSRCPEHYREHQAFWLATARTIINDTTDGNDARLSLGLAIDMLWPCHWDFVKNLEIVVAAVGGQLHPKTPFAACGRNVSSTPIRSRMETVADTLRAFQADEELDKEIDRQILDLLGEPTGPKRWLAASLAKTIRLQLDPPAEMRAQSVMTGPNWVYQSEQDTHRPVVGA